MDQPPNSLTPLLAVLLHWLSSQHCALVDISRAYQSVLTGPKEKFMRLSPWRPQEDGTWAILAYNSMLYGKKAAATGLELAKLKTATMARHIDPEVADQIAAKCMWMMGLSQQLPRPG